jgi:calcineurin-like phosphoesterase family protein
MNRTFFTADTHFGHANIIKYSSRPFKSAEEMDDTIIHNWNALVQPGDTVYHLGDFAVGGGEAEPYYRRLNGNIEFCWGNHDNRLKRIPDIERHGTIEHVRHISVHGQKIFLSHYAHRVWDGSHKGAWHLYGHSHGTLPDDPNSLSMDVGVDTNNMMPYSFQDIQRIMAHKKFKAVDHHGTH